MQQAFQYGSTNARLMDYDAVSGINKLYASAGGTVLAEYTELQAAVPTWTKSYTYFGETQLATITPNGNNENIEFNHPDRLGTRAVTNQQTGSYAEQSHLPFGVALNAESSITNNNKRFTSYDRSPRTGLDYAVNRHYDSRQGRFTQADPMGIDAASINSPQTLNLYSYCGNDPVNHVDPSGLFWGWIKKFFNTVFGALKSSKLARRIAIRFVVSFVTSGGNIGVAIQSVVPDILGALGLAPPGFAVTPAWNPELPYPISYGGLGSVSRYVILNFLSAASKGGPIWWTAIRDAYWVLKNDRKCARFFGLLDRNGRFSNRKFEQLKKNDNYYVDVSSRQNIAHTNGNDITFEAGFFNDGWFTGSPAPHSLKNPRQGRAQTVLHELGHSRGLLISPDNSGFPTDPNSPANKNEKAILDHCGKGLSKVPTEY